MEKLIKIVRFGHFQIWKYNQNLQAVSSKNASFRSAIVEGKVQNKVIKLAPQTAANSGIA